MIIPAAEILSFFGQHIDLLAREAYFFEILDVRVCVRYNDGK